MSRLNINIGTTANDRTGDPLRTAFEKVNANFIELYSAVGADVAIPTQTGNANKYLTTNGTTLRWDNLSNSIYAGGPGGTRWEFEELSDDEGETYYGRINFPDGTSQYTAFTGTQLVNGVHTVSLGTDGNLTVPDRITFDDGSWQSTAFVGHAYSLRNNADGSLYVTLDDSGTINTPLLLPLTFTAVLDPTHYIGEGTLVLEGDAWEFEVQFQVGMDGTVQTMIGNNTPWVSNPGYIDDLEFEFVEADHGIPGYTFTLGLYDVVQAGPAGWTTNLTASIPPEYPSTIKSLGAIKLSATGETVVPGQQIIASDAQGGITNDYITVWVEGGGTNYPEIVAVQPGWTVVGEGLNYVSVTNTELITQFPGSVIYRITTSISSAKMGYEYTFIEPDSSEPDLKNWVFGTDGQLTVPGAIFRDGGLYMNSSGSTTAASVFVSGNSGSVILRTANNAELISYDLTVDVDGETTFPGRLNFSDGSTLGDNILTGAIDSDLGLEIKRIVTVSGAHMGPNSPDVLLVDITEDDDITIVQAGWELNTGSEIAPIWLPVETVSRNENVYYLIAVSGVTFETGVTYTFRNPVPESQTWFIRNQTGGLVAPGGATITNETAPLGGGSTYRELAIELPTPDGLNEQRWVFANDGDFTAPGDIFAGSFLGQSLEITDAGIVASTYAGELQTLHVAGAVGKGLSLAVNGGLTSWLYDLDGKIHLPAGGDIVDSTGTSVLGGGGASLTVITPDDVEISNVATLVFTGAGVTASSAGNAVTLDITGGSANTGDFTFTNSTASLPLGNTMTLQTYENGGNKESVLTLAPTGDSALDVGGGLRVRTAYGTGFEKSWTFNTDGSITFPDATTQSTAYTGDVANTRTSGSGYVTLAGGVTDVIYTIQPWMVSSKLVICVESEVDSDGTFTKHTQTCEATIAATYNYTNEPVISVYGLVYTSPNPLATFSTRRGAGNVIEVVAANIQGTKIATFSIHAIQFISTHD